MMISRRGVLIGSAALLASSAARANGPEMLTIEGPAFGAGWRVRIEAGVDGNAVADTVVAVVTAVDASLSPFRAETEISRFNTAQTTDFQPISAGFSAVLSEAKRIAALTSGAFDPTLGGVSGRYGFGPIHQAPAGAFRDLMLDHRGARKSDPRQTLDLCGIAKGYALDQAVAALSALGHRAFMVEMGGEVKGRGAHPSGRAWQVGVEHPLAAEGALWHRVALAGEALATSGDRVNSYDLGAHRYGHIIDPRGNRPAETPLTSVSVLTPSACTADALATAFFALGSEAGPELAQRLGVPALFLIRDGAGLRDVMTANYQTRILG